MNVATKSAWFTIYKLTSYIYDIRYYYTNRKLEETYMFDFIINLFAEIADFFITFWADNVIDKFAKRKK